MAAPDLTHETPPHALMREPAVAGTFYPGDSRTLGAEIDALLARAKVRPREGIIYGMIVPHAGYAYSGYAASLAYKLLRGKTFDCVAIVSPSHREYFDGISVYNGAGYRTPLGDLLIDDEARTKLLAGDPVIEASQMGHRGEHAIEVHLPFIQRVLGDVKILPIVMGEQRREYCFFHGTAPADI